MPCDAGRPRASSGSMRCIGLGDLLASHGITHAKKKEVSAAMNAVGEGRWGLGGKGLVESQSWCNSCTL